MPFQSRKQLRWCFASEDDAKRRGEKFKIDCMEWLKSTPDPYCLPEVKGGEVKCKDKKGPLIGSIKTGPRGGKFKRVAGTKVYLKR